MARLMIGKSDSSCSRCCKGANGTVLTHDVIHATRWDPKEKRAIHFDIPGCGETWDGMQSTYVYPNGYWEQWVKQPSDYALQAYAHMVGKPCYDAFGKFVGNFAEGIDIQQELDYNE